MMNQDRLQRTLLQCWAPKTSCRWHTPFHHAAGKMKQAVSAPLLSIMLLEGRCTLGLSPARPSCCLRGEAPWVCMSLLLLEGGCTLGLSPACPSCRWKGDASRLPPDVVLPMASHADRMAALCQQHPAAGADIRQACLEAARAAHESHQQRKAAWQATFLERQQRARCACRRLLCLTRLHLPDTCVQEHQAVYINCLPAHTLCMLIAASISLKDRL